MQWIWRVFFPFKSVEKHVEQDRAPGAAGQRRRICLEDTKGFMEASNAAL